MSLRALVPDAASLLTLAVPDLVGMLSGTLKATAWRGEALELLRGTWREQVMAAAAVALGGGDATLAAAVWEAADRASWVSPQLVAAAFVVDAAFDARAEERLLGHAARPPKLIGALVRAYHRLPAPRMSVLAELARHDRVLATEEARVGVRGVDAWLDRLPALVCQERAASWARLPRQPPSSRAS